VSRAVKFVSGKEHLEWLHSWRAQNVDTLAEYDPGLKRKFNELGADVTDEHKAGLRRTISEIDVMIEKATSLGG
jgi:hypothetical protein